MKKRDKFWLDRIIWIFLVIILFIAVSFYNIIELNGSYLTEEKAEVNIFKKQIEWAITPILKKQNIIELQKYCDDFKDDREFAFRIFDKNKNLLASSSKNRSLEIADDDSILSKTKHSLWDLYKHSFKDNSLEQTTELNIDNSKYYIEISISEEFVIKSLINAQKNIIILFGICLILLTLFICHIFLSIKKSFNSLEDSVIQISNGRLDTEIEIPKNGLLHELALAIVKMTNKLKIQIKRLSKLEQYKTEFIQNITHEIKTPITAINSAIELIEIKNEAVGINKECLDIINFQTNSINKLAEDILALSEIDLKKTEEIKTLAPVNLTKIAQQAIKYHLGLNCKINLIKTEDITTDANADLLLMAISNLLSNAVKYSKSDKIDVIISKEKNTATIEIKDYGIGIKKEHLPHIFERFYTIDKSRSKEKGGSGLGLSIVKNIIELHNWNITVESKLNKGTSFKIYT